MTQAEKQPMCIGIIVCFSLREMPNMRMKYGMGNFRNDIYGDYIRYTHASCHSYVVMDIGGKILVVNGADDSETKRIYDTLIEKCQMN